MSIRFENVLMLDDAKTIEAAREWHRAAWRLDSIVQGGHAAVEGAQWRAELNKVWQLQGRLLRVCAAEPGGP